MSLCISFRSHYLFLSEGLGVFLFFSSSFLCLLRDLIWFLDVGIFVVSFTLTCFPSSCTCSIVLRAWVMSVIRSCSLVLYVEVFFWTDSPECEMEPCLNNGECQRSNALPRGYICICPTGFLGDNCEGNPFYYASNSYHTLFIVFIHFYSASLSKSHSEAFLPTASILCWS